MAFLPCIVATSRSIWNRGTGTQSQLFDSIQCSPTDREFYSQRIKEPSSSGPGSFVLGQISSCLAVRGVCLQVSSPSADSGSPPLLLLFLEMLSSTCLLGYFFHFPYVKVAQPCPTLCDPTDCSPPDFSVHGILQARILE